MDREKVLKTEQERELWRTIDYNYLTEVSEHEEDDEVIIHCHSIPWRSESKLCMGMYVYNH